MKKYLNKILTFLAIILFSTCGFEFSEDYFKEITISKPIVSLSLTNLKENDTLIRPREIEYKYNAPDKNLLYQINFYVDSKVIYQSSKKESHFPLEIKSLSNGNHNLKIEYIFRLGSESMADLTGKELYKLEENISFEVNNNVPIEIKEVKIVDGVIRIYFKPYKLIDEISSSTEILLFSESEYGSYVFNINEYHLNNNFYDYRNFGSTITYYTKVKNSYTETISKKEVLKVNDTFTVDIEIKNTNETIIKWTKHPVYNTFEPHVNIKNTEHRFDSSYLLDTKVDNQRTVVLGQFGRIYNYKVQHNISGNNYTSAIFQGSVTLGERFEAPKNGFIKIIHSNQNNRFYALSIEQINENSPESDVYIYELESDDLKTIKRTKITTSTNTYGDLIKDSSGNLIIDLNSKSIVLDINSFSILQEHSISEYSNYENSTIISYRDKLLFKRYSSVTEIFDTTTKKKIISFSENGNLLVTKNGKYFSFKNKIYKMENSTVSEVLQIYLFDKIKGLDMDINNDKLYYLDGSEGSIRNDLYEYDLNTKISKKTPSLPTYISSFYFSSDEQKVICKHSDYTNKDLYILDINNNQVKSIKADFSSSFSVFNDKLISSNGTYLEIFF